MDYGIARLAAPTTTKNDIDCYIWKQLLCGARGYVWFDWYLIIAITNLAIIGHCNNFENSNITGCSAIKTSTYIGKISRMSDTSQSLLGNDSRLSLPAHGIVHDFFPSQSTDGSVEFECEKKEEIVGGHKTWWYHWEKPSTLMHLLLPIYVVSNFLWCKYSQRLMPYEAANVEPVLVVLMRFGV